MQSLMMPVGPWIPRSDCSHQTIFRASQPWHLSRMRERFASFQLFFVRPLGFRSHRRQKSLPFLALIHNPYLLPRVSDLEAYSQVCTITHLLLQALKRVVEFWEPRPTPSPEISTPSPPYSITNSFPAGSASAEMKSLQQPLAIPTRRAPTRINEGRCISQDY